MPKIDETSADVRARYERMAEELRRAGREAEAEQAIRNGERVAAEVARLAGAPQREGRIL